MLNNKGLVITTALYSLLVAFLLFLGITLATFASSANQLGKANSDLTDGKRLSGSQIKLESNKSSNWYLFKASDDDDDDDANQNLAVVNSRYGTVYWPKDSDAGASYTFPNYKLDKNSGSFTNNTNLKWYFFKKSESDYELTETIENGMEYILLICDELIGGSGNCAKINVSNKYVPSEFRSDYMTIIKLGKID